MTEFLQMLQYPFLLRALAAGLPVALCCALLGVSLVLKRYSMIGDGLSHVAFGTLSVALALHWAPLPITLPIVMAAAFLLLRMRERKGERGDAAVALLSVSSLAVGITAASVTTGMNVDVMQYMFGSILAVSTSDVFLCIGLCTAAVPVYLLFRRQLFSVTFDEDFSGAIGLRTGWYTMLLAFLTAAVIVVGMRLTGALLMSGLMVFPALTAMRVCRSFRGVTLCACALSLLCFLGGMAISFVLSVPTGAAIVLVNLAAYLIFTLAGRVMNG